MHEFSVAEGMLDVIEEQVGGRPRLVSAQVLLGPLAGIHPESLATAFPEAAAARGMGRPALEITRVAARARCAACDTEYGMEDAFTVCPACGSLQRALLSGEEFRLQSVEVEEDEDG